MTITTLSFVRHAHASWPSGAITDGDDKRPLSDYGRKQVAASLPILQRHGLAPSLILYSPLTRTRQTAELLSDALGVPSQRETMLRPGFSTEELDLMMGAYHQHGWLMLVGHNPDLSTVASLLAHENLNFPVGGVATLGITRTNPRLRAELRWFYRGGQMP